MDRRKNTKNMGVKIPREYLKLVEDVFNKNFSKQLQNQGPSKSKTEFFLSFGELYPDELVLVVSLKGADILRLTTCYASVDYPPPAFKLESGQAQISNSEAVQTSVNQCVDVIASFFNTFFEEGRPIDYDTEYRQNWTPIELEKNTRVYLKINHDNLELEAQADAILEESPKSGSALKKKKLN